MAAALSAHETSDMLDELAGLLDRAWRLDNRIRERVTPGTLAEIAPALNSVEIGWSDLQALRATAASLAEHPS